ncbi:hypothetical protein BOX15_Mlig029887g1 [Macrostomum lignano]|uniref:Uncharacterized protein n=2 Tax=Macrostomum lignano TaxID=282301 RepID=A0A267FXI4_9PLAT|nr:hypothetical protein BOX15_Mlig029887g1 [Macrostomum lignano]
MSNQSLAAIVVGYTGETGKELVNALAHTQAFSRISLLGRRDVQLPDEVVSSGKFEQKRVDFDALDSNPESQSELFAGHDVTFCCLGTTRAKSGADGFVKVDHDYVMATAKASKASHVKQFHLVSSAGANKNSMLLYPRIKGQVEENLANLGFDRLAIYRPKMLICKREESRPAEAAAMVLLKPFQTLCPTWLTTPVSTLAQAMINAALVGGSQRDLYYNAEIFQLAARNN